MAQYRVEYVAFHGKTGEIVDRMQRQLDANQRKLVAVVPFGMAGALLVREVTKPRPVRRKAST